MTRRPQQRRRDADRSAPSAAGCDPVGIPEVARRLGVKRSTVDTWRQRGQLLEPRWVVGGRPAWDWPDVLEWAKDSGRLA